MKVNSEETDDVIYDPMGRRVTAPQMGGGVYIVNGNTTFAKHKYPSNVERVSIG